MPDDEIDTSDIPPTPDSFWNNAVRGKYYRPVKASTTVRIDADVLAWLRQHGAGYQSRINAILRDAMLRSRPGGLAEAAPFKAPMAKRR